jgi:ABC-type nitrate/sulfonate/bicarbonate transport system ATPase subunit
LNDTRPAGATSPLEIFVEEKTHHGAGGGRTPAIRNFRLDVAPSSLTVLMGPSGCGKTTLLRIVSGLDRDFKGRVTMPRDGRIGFVFQDPRLLPWRTVRQNIELVAHDALSEDELQELAAALGIDDKLDA